MRPPVPARITIELLPSDGVNEGWTTRTTLSQGDDDTPRQPLAVFSGEPRVEAPIPAGYEADGCTCHEDWCGRDHDND